MKNQPWICSFFDPGIWPLAYAYVALRDTYSGWNYPSLGTSFWRVYWHNTPGAALRIAGRIIPIRPNRLYIIPPRVDYASIHHANCRQLFIHFQIRHPYTLRGPAVITLPLTRQRRHMVRRIVAVHGDAGTTQSRVALLIHALLDTIIADLMSRYLTFRDIDQRLLGALNYFEQHLSHHVGNQQLAGLMHLHPKTMLRLFKTGLDQSPQEYLRQLRIDKASLLLRFSDKSIKTVAEETGFCDRYHFTKVFSKFTGQSPACFRAGLLSPAFPNNRNKS